MRVSNFPVISAGDMSASITSAAFPVYQVYGWSAQFVFSGAPVGVLTVEVSDDPFQPEGTVQPTNWTLLADSTIAIAAAGNAMYNVDLGFYNWVRFIYTRTSGTGTINGRMNTKGV